LECAAKLDDRYWEDLLMSMAKGTFPKGFKFDGKNVIYKIKSKFVTFNLSPEVEIPIDLLFSQFKSFISTYSGLMSSKDLEQIDSLQTCNKESCQNVESKWGSNISSKLQIILIKVYCTNKIKEYHYNNEIGESLLSEVYFAILNKEITPENIEMKNGCISNINNIIFEASYFRIIKVTQPKKRITRKSSTENSAKTQKNMVHVFSCSKNIEKSEKKYL